MGQNQIKRGLGVGLDALFGTLEEEKREVETLPIAKIEPRAGQPRTKFDEEALSELSESIKEYGVIQPLTVRKLPSGYYQIIAGERRWRAARLAGLRELPVRVIEADDRLATELALVENLQREDLNPIEEALGYKKLMDDFGMTQEEAAARVGKSRPAVANSVRLLSLSEAVLALVESGELSAGHARALLPVSPAELQLEAAETVIKKALSVRKTEELAKSLMREPKTEKIPDGIRVDYLSEAARSLEKSLGRRVTMTENGQRGRIVLEYYGSEDRENLLEALSGLKNNRGDNDDRH